VVNDYIDTSATIRRAQYVDVAANLKIVIEPSVDSTTSTEASTTSGAPETFIDSPTPTDEPVIIPREVAIPALEMRHARVVEYIRNLDRTGLDASTLELVADLEAQVDSLHTSNEVMLDASTGDGSTPWWAVALIVLLLGAGWIIVWRRRWVSIDEEACTACGECTNGCADFFMPAPDGRAFVTTQSADTADRRPEHRIRLPRRRADRRKVFQAAKHCEPEAIKVTVRRRMDDPRID